jgi:hypothetical protein
LRGVSADHFAIFSDEGWNQNNLTTDSFGLLIPRNPDAVGSPQLAFGKVLRKLLGSESERFVCFRGIRPSYLPSGFVVPMNDQFTVHWDSLRFLVVKIDSAAKASGWGGTWRHEDIGTPDDRHAARHLVFLFFAPRPLRLAFFRVFRSLLLSEGCTATKETEGPQEREQGEEF